MGGSSSKPAAHPEGKTMKAIAFNAYGEPDKLQKVELPKPQIKVRGDLLIKVRAAALNPVDKILLAGGMKLVRGLESFPHVIGYDAAGVVEVADSAGTFKVGDAVMVRLFSPAKEVAPQEKKVPYFRGSCAEYCVAQACDCALKPENVSFEEAASVPLAGMTALQCLKKVKEGDRVFISGGAGGVGSLAIQLAKNIFKAGFVATTASAGEKEELCKSLGADQVVDYKTAKFEDVYAAEGQKFDVCFDTTAESLKMANVVKRGGHVVTIAGKPTVESIQAIGGGGYILSMVLPKTTSTNEYKACKASGADWSHLFLQPSSDDIRQLASAMESASVKAIIDGVWDLDDDDDKDGWRGAFTKQFSGRAKGKCVIKMA